MDTKSKADELLGFDPYVEWNAFRDALRQLLDEGVTNPRDLPAAALASMIIPLDLLDTGPALVVRANMPGVKLDHLMITLDGNALTLKGEVTPDGETDTASYLRHERRVTTYTRSLILPVTVDADHAETSLRSGVLTLTLPKSESARRKIIRVTGG